MWHQIVVFGMILFNIGQFFVTVLKFGSCKDENLLRDTKGKG